MIYFPATNPEVTTSSVISHVVDQATLSTMQAEMIAVQVLSQSASGDIQYLQQQAPQQFIPIVSGADASTLSTLQATLGQVQLGAVQVRTIAVSQTKICLYSLHTLLYYFPVNGVR